MKVPACNYHAGRDNKLWKHERPTRSGKTASAPGRSIQTSFSVELQPFLLGDGGEPPRGSMATQRQKKTIMVPHRSEILQQKHTNMNTNKQNHSLILNIQPGRQTYCISIYFIYSMDMKIQRLNHAKKIFLYQQISPPTCFFISFFHSTSDCGRLLRTPNCKIS